MEYPAVFQTRTLRPTNEVLIWFKHLTQIKVETFPGDQYLATLTEFELFAIGETETAALRALADKLQTQLIWLSRLPPHWLSPLDRANVLRRYQLVDLKRSAIVQLQKKMFN